MFKLSVLNRIAEKGCGTGYLFHVNKHPCCFIGQYVYETGHKAIEFLDQSKIVNASEVYDVFESLTDATYFNVYRENDNFEGTNKERGQHMKEWIMANYEVENDLEPAEIAP